MVSEGGLEDTYACADTPEPLLPVPRGERWRGHNKDALPPHDGVGNGDVCALASQPNPSGFGSWSSCHVSVDPVGAN